VICGAGIAGIAAAWHLAVRHGIRDVLLVDERPPLSLTSDKSTEAYRNWWPGPDDTMIRLMDHSIAWLERWAEMSDNRFLLNRRGYVYASADSHQAAAIRQRAEQTAALGAGPLRIHTTPAASYRPAHPEAYRDQPAGADLLCHPELIRRHFGYLNPHTRIVLHARNCGWFSGQQLGMWLLEQGREHGVRLLRGRVTGVETEAGRVSGVQVRGEDGVDRPITTHHFVNAAGPFLKPVAALTGATLPLFSERHLKLSIRDRLGIVPREAPLLIWEDSQFLPWSAEEREWLAASASDRWLTGRFPPGAHLRPEGGSHSQILLLLWAWHTEPVAEQFPLPPEPLFPEIVLRGMTALVPGLAALLDNPPTPWVDGGYYTKVADNRPIVGPLPTPGAWIVGALSGYGLMAAAATGDLLAAHITGSPLPPWAAPLHPARLHDPAWHARVAAWGDTAQL
jgi:glycine/D-amino acid oxidase-like deaminating enzyme